MASILINGSPTVEFSIFCGLKQGDPLAPFLLILVMETLHISVSRAVNDGVFKGEWSDDNLANLIRILQCFKLASGLKINVQKSQVLGVGVSSDIVNQGASIIGCSVMHAPCKYLGVTLGDHMSRHSAWLNTIQKVRTRLSKWKTLSIYKAPKGVLHEMEMIRNNFFNGADSADRKITWVAWDKVLASKKHGGLSVSSYYALNRALLLKWVWCFLSQDGSLWSRVIGAIYGSSIEYQPSNISSCSSSILREVQVLISKGFDFLSHCKIRVGNGLNTRFWLDTWIMDLPLSIRFPRIYALERIKDMFNTFSLDATWLNLSSKEFAVGGISIGLMFRRLSSGILGSLLFSCRVSLNLCWKEFLSRLGGLFGLFGTGLVLKSLLLGVQ
nr:RNA-directed DNA polymerase, eukaryota [Tanacetum cinerariifolium]